MVQKLLRFKVTNTYPLCLTNDLTTVLGHCALQIQCRMECDCPSCVRKVFHTCYWCTGPTADLVTHPSSNTTNIASTLPLCHWGTVYQRKPQVSLLIYPLHFSQSGAELSHWSDPSGAGRPKLYVIGHRRKLDLYSVGQQGSSDVIKLGWKVINLDKGGQAGSSAEWCNDIWQVSTCCKCDLNFLVGKKPKKIKKIKKI